MSCLERCPQFSGILIERGSTLYSIPTFRVSESDSREEGEGHAVGVGEGLLEWRDSEQLPQSLEMDSDVLLGVGLCVQRERERHTHNIYLLSHTIMPIKQQITHSCSCVCVWHHLLTPSPDSPSTNSTVSPCCRSSTIPSSEKSSNLFFLCQTEVQDL